MPEFTLEQMALEYLADQCLEEAAQILETNEGLFFDAVMQAESFEAAMDAVLDLYTRLSVSALADVLHRGLLMATVFGHYTAQQELPEIEVADGGN